MEKFDCLQDRSAALPDRSDKEIGETLAKFTDYVSLKLNCPRIIKNGNYSISGATLYINKITAVGFK